MSVDSKPSAPAVIPKTAAETLRQLCSNSQTGLSTPEAEFRRQRDGANEIAEEKSHPLLAIAKKFWGPPAWMLELLAVVSIAVGKLSDAIIAVTLLVVNAGIGYFQQRRANAAMAALRRKLNIRARVLRDGKWAEVPSRELVVGDVVRVRAGDFIPADLQDIEGAVGLDQSSLTGESRAVEKTSGDMLYSGSVLASGEATGVVVATGAGTYFGRTAQLVAGASPKMHVEEIISRIVKWLFAIIGTLTAITIAVSLARQTPLMETLPIVLLLLMSAIPVALPVMFTVSMALGSVELSRQGVLVTRLNAVEDAATMDTLCADKTGTLTMNRLSFAGCGALEEFTEDDILSAGLLASREENADPIDLAFIAAARAKGITPGATLVSFTPFSAATRRTEAVVDLDGHRVRCVKGALDTVAKLCGLAAGALVELKKGAEGQSEKGLRTLAVARGEEGAPLKMLGLAFLHDPPRPDSRILIERLRRLGVAVKMLTGDALPVGREIAKELGLGAVAKAADLERLEREDPAKAAALAVSSDGFAEVFPEDKFMVVKSLQAAGHVVGMTGDGVNDAPALRQAEVGIAVCDSTDVAKGAASAVLTDPGLTNIVAMVATGRAIYQRVLTWVINKICNTLLKSGLVVVPFLVTGRFVFSAMTMLLLFLVNDFVIITLATDNTRASETPESWRISPLVVAALVLGGVMLAEALVFLALCGRRLELGSNLEYAQAFCFQFLLFFSIFSVLSIRERRAFWSSRPGTPLMVAMAGEAVGAILIALYGLGSLPALPLQQLALILGATLVLALGPNDLLKTALIGWAVGKMRSDNGQRV